jgi:MFS family permease
MNIARSLRHTFRFLKGNIAFFSVTLTLGNFARQMAFPYASLYVLALGGNATVIGLINSMRPLLGLVMFPLGGYFADQASRVKLIVLANAFSVGIVLLRFVAPSWEVLAVAALLQGLAVLGFPARSALIADSLPPQDRGRGIATMNTISGGLAILAPYLAGVIVDAYGPNTGVRALYGAMLALYAASTLIHYRLLEDSVPDSGKRFQPAILPRVLKDTYTGTPALLRRLPRSLKVQAAVIVLTFMSNGVASSFWVVYAVEEIGLSSSAWGLVLLVETVLRMCLFLPTGMLVDRWGRAASLRVALFIALLSIPPFVFATSFVQVLLIRAAIAVTYAIALPASTALMADTVPREMRGRVMAAIGHGGIMIGAAGGGTGGPGVGYVVTVPLMLASFAGGVMYAFDPRYPWLFVTISTAISIVLAALFVRDPQQAEV